MRKDQFMSLSKTLCMFVVKLSSILLCHSVHATFSIIACEKETKTCAAAVATNNLAVGASVIYAKAGVGAIASQFETNPNYGHTGLEMLAQGKSSSSIISSLLKHDNNFDGSNTEDRQVAVIGLQNGAAVHTGKNLRNSEWAGSINGKYYRVQGNGLHSETVILAIQDAFVNSKGMLAERLLEALLAGQQQGGQTTGKMSAALLVKTLEGFPHDINLRVDFSKTPLEDLRQLVNFHYARQMMINAGRLADQDKFDKAWFWVDKALVLGADWDRIWRRAAHLAIQGNNVKKVTFYLDMFRTLNPQWFALEIKHARYASLHNTSRFKELMEHEEKQ
jgi:uncharacterized Ntn-hydrolase superfamily protein